jgi:hypothetical protein
VKFSGFCCIQLVSKSVISALSLVLLALQRRKTVFVLIKRHCDSDTHDSDCIIVTSIRVQ